MLFCLKSKFIFIFCVKQIFKILSVKSVCQIACLMYCTEYQPKIQVGLQHTCFTPLPYFLGFQPCSRSSQAFCSQVMRFSCTLRVVRQIDPSSLDTLKQACWPIHPILLMEGPQYVFKFSHCHCEELQWLGVSHYTLSHSCLKVHGGVPIVLCIFFDPLVLRINCLVSRQLFNALFLNHESSILKP